MDSVLRSSYYDLSSPSAYTGLRNIFREVRAVDPKIKLADVKEYLQKQDTYTLHEPLRRKFPRRKTVAARIDSDWQADLCDVQHLKKYNDGFGYILTVIDVLSKFAWVEPVPDKSPRTVAKAFRKILQSSGRKCWRLYTDKGWEFRGKPFQDMLEEYGIQYISSESPDIKASVAERFNRTLKSRIWKYFTANKTLKFLDCLEKIIHAYNNTYHTSIRRRPVEVNSENEREVWRVLYGPNPFGSRSPIEFKFSVGDSVRIARSKGVFGKGYLPNFTEELFKIRARINSTPPSYRIEDLGKEEIQGIFYEPELVKVVKTDEVYRIETVLKKRSRKGKKEIFVKWLGYPEKFNQWILESELRLT